MVTNKGPVIKSYLEIYFKTGQLPRSFPKYNHYITNLSIPDYFLFSNYLKTFSASCRYMEESFTFLNLKIQTDTSPRPR